MIHAPPPCSDAGQPPFPVKYHDSQACHFPRDVYCLPTKTAEQNGLSTLEHLLCPYLLRHHLLIALEAPTLSFVKKAQDLVNKSSRLLPTLCYLQHLQEKHQSSSTASTISTRSNSALHKWVVIRECQTRESLCSMVTLYITRKQTSNLSKTHLIQQLSETKPIP